MRRRGLGARAARDAWKAEAAGPTATGLAAGWLAGKKVRRKMMLSVTQGKCFK